MFTLDDFTWGRTRVRLPDGTETVAVRHRPAETLGAFYQAGAATRTEREWLAGKLSDDEAAARGLRLEWQVRLKRDPAWRTAGIPLFEYWADLTPDDTVIETRSVLWPLVRLQEIAAIDNGDGWTARQEETP